MTPVSPPTSNQQRRNTGAARDAITGLLGEAIVDGWFS